MLTQRHSSESHAFAGWAHFSPQGGGRDCKTAEASTTTLYAHANTKLRGQTKTLPAHPTQLRARQGGVVLLITLIVLVAMTLTAIALVRSMDTTNIIAGNLAFQQSATHSGDAGVEAAIALLETNVANLQTDLFFPGYSASFTNPVAGQSWDAYFTALVTAGRTATLAPDAVGNTVTYAIHRLCLQPGSPTAVGVGCTVTPATTATVSSSEDAGTVKLNASAQQYYRITSRIVGPHNTKSYVQAIIAL